MTETQTRNLIEKLSRLTEARGATPAEAARAREKVQHLEATLPKAHPRKPGVYVEGWPGQDRCDHRPDRQVWYKDGTLFCKKCKKTYVPEAHIWRKF